MSNPFFGMMGSKSYGKDKKLLDRYGVEGQRGGGRAVEISGKSYRSSSDVEKDLQRAMSQDPDTRRSLEAAAMSGDKKAQKLIKKGFKNFDQMHKTQKYFEKQHKKEGGGGEFSSVNDYMNLTNSLVNKERDAQTASYDERYAKTTDLNSLKDKLMAEASDKAVAAPIEPSDRMAAVEDRMENAAGGSGNRPPSLFDKDNALPAKTDDQKDAARNFVEDYKKDVMKGANIKSDIQTGISNAAKHVTNVYGR